MNILWFLSGVATGAVGLFVILVILVARKLRARGQTWGIPGMEAHQSDRGIKEKCQVGEQVSAVLSGRNGKQIFKGEKARWG